MKEVAIHTEDYPHSKFISYFKSSQHDTYQLMVLSEEKDTKGNDYVIHTFNIEKNLLIWAGKFSIEIGGRKLRKKYPMIKLYDSDYIALVDEKEKIHLISTSPDRKDFIYEYKEKKVRNIFLCLGKAAYLTFSNDNKVVALPLYEEEIDKTLSIEVGET